MRLDERWLPHPLVDLDVRRTFCVSTSAARSRCLGRRASGRARPAAIAAPVRAPAPCAVRHAGWIVNQVAQFMRIGFQVIELGRETVRRAVAVRVTDELPVVGAHAAHVGRVGKLRLVVVFVEERAAPAASLALQQRLEGPPRDVLQRLARRKGPSGSARGHGSAPSGGSRCLV